MNSDSLILAITVTSGTIGGISAGFTVGFFDQINRFRPLIRKIPERYMAELLICRYTMLTICFLFSVIVLLLNAAAGLLSLYLDLGALLLSGILIAFITGLYSLLIPLFFTTVQEVRLSRSLLRGL